MARRISAPRDSRVPGAARGLPHLLFAAGALLIAAKPALWLVRSWIAPEYGSEGGGVALLATAVAVWSLSSPLRPGQPAGRDPRRIGGLLVLTALVRLAGQVLGVNVVGAAALVVDVWALGLLAGLDRRGRAVSPAWLAVLFAASFPVELLVRRTIGFGLQQLSAAGACAVLSFGFGDVACTGTVIGLAGHEIQVDLPCSGARGLLLSGVLFAALAALGRPPAPRALAGVLLTLAASLFANVVRIAVLAAGTARPDLVGGIDVMTSPAHDAIGLATLGLGCGPVLLWGRSVFFRAPRRVFVPDAPAPVGADARARGVGGAVVFALAAVAIVSAPSKPLDVAAPSTDPILPAWLAGHPAEPEALTSREKRYFELYGGGAARARYGEHELLVVRTTAPLRHLHSPEECLTGAGHRVRYRGRRSSPLLSGDYVATGPDGREYDVSVTFVSERGEIVTSVAEAVWLWLGRPGVAWTMLQRITPAGAPAAGLHEWETALARAFDLKGDPA